MGGEGTATSSGAITIRTANAGVSGSSGKLVFSSGTTSGGNSGALFLGSGKATGGRGGLVEITVGDGDTGTGGYVMISGGRTIATSFPGGNVYIRPGQGPTTGGVTYLQSADGTTTVLQVTDSTVKIDTGSFLVDTSSETRIEAASTITLDANSGILLGGSKVSGYEYDTCTVSGTSTCSLNKQTGIITSATSSLAAGALETISLSNDRIVATGAVFVTVQNRCTHGYIMVASVTTSNGEAEIVVTNIGTYACSSTYKLAFFVVSSGT